MANTKLKIGILGLQGCVELHIPHINSCGLEYIKVRKPEDFEISDAFIIPGGESTTMLKLLSVLDLFETAQTHFKEKPVWGICAGAILMAFEVINPAQQSFSLIDMKISRNGYGRQLDSKEFEISEANNYKVSFIRAPVIKQTGKNTKTLATMDSAPIWVTNGKYMATTFHPELNNTYPSPFHEFFMDMIINNT